MDSARFDAAISAFDEANRRDPNEESENGQPYPREWLYAQWLTNWVKRLQANPSEELLLAARCQHIERWKIPRADFPAGRRGYLDWRDRLKEYHAQRAGEILRQVGYPEATIGRVQTLNMKEDIKGDPEMQVLEDALCLVFLEKQFHEFKQKTDERRMLRIIRKTWDKMSPRARDIALSLDLPRQDRQLVEKALATD